MYMQILLSISILLFIAGQVLSFAPKRMPLAAKNQQSITSKKSITNITSQEQFDKIPLSTGNATIICFSKTSCKPCIRIVPQYEYFAAKNSDINCYKMNYEELGLWALSLFKTQGIRSTPTFKVYDSIGQSIDMVNNMEDLENAIDDLKTRSEKQK